MDPTDRRPALAASAPDTPSLSGPGSGQPGDSSPFLAGYNLNDDGGLYVVFSPAFFRTGKDPEFATRVKDFVDLFWDVRSGKIKPTG